MEENKNKNTIIKILFLSFIIFLIVTLSKNSGYYEYKMYLKTKLTDENIKEFETKIKEGEDVSNVSYIEKNYIDYSNKVSDLGYKTGNLIEKIMNKGIKKTLKILDKLF